MIDLETGRFVLRKGMELYPGMTREEFFESPFYKEEIRWKKDKDNPREECYHIKTQEIDGYKMDMDIYFSNDDEYGDYVEEIEMTKPEYYDWPEGWPRDWKKYAYSIKRYNDEFLEKQIEGSIREGKELWYDYNWGSITSSINLRDIPIVMITIRYDITIFKEAKGKKYKRLKDLTLEELEKIFPTDD